MSIKITNKYNLPSPLVSAVKNDPYPDNPDWNISTTSLISPPRIVQLKKRHRGELHEDVSDNIYRLLGTNTHHILERVNTPNCIKEERYSAYINGWKLAGQIDLYEQGPMVLSDYKVSSVWSVINGIKIEHEAQGNINAWLMNQNGYEIKKIQVVILIRDWSKHQVRKSDNYPKCQVAVQNVPVWPEEKITEYLYKRVKMHQRAEETPSDGLPFCTPEERWQSSNKWAVKKPKRKSAIRVLDSEEKALNYIKDKNLDDKHFVEFRAGESKRCKSYCSVSEFCNQFLEMEE